TYTGTRQPVKQPVLLNLIEDGRVLMRQQGRGSISTMERCVKSRMFVIMGQRFTALQDPGIPEANFRFRNFQSMTLKFLSPNLPLKKGGNQTAMLSNSWPIKVCAATTTLPVAKEQLGETSVVKMFISPVGNANIPTCASILLKITARLFVTMAV